eukprot:5552153-Alexandrium_andersonii.AAC.1
MFKALVCDITKAYGQYATAGKPFDVAVHGDDPRLDDLRAQRSTPSRPTRSARAWPGSSAAAPGPAPLSATGATR